MITNRSMPPGTIIPELAYPDVPAAAAWLCRCFGFCERLRIGTHRAQLTKDDGSIVVTEGAARGDGALAPLGHSVMVRVADVEAHHAHAVEAGAKILMPPTDFPYGERQYAAEDLGGHRWVFSQSIADRHPSEWGGSLLE